MGKRKNSKNGKRVKIILGIVASVFVLILLAAGWYINDYYRAEVYVDSYLKSSETVTVTTKDNIVFLDGSGTEHALIFYPDIRLVVPLQQTFWQNMANSLTGLYYWHPTL